MCDSKSSATLYKELTKTRLFGNAPPEAVKKIAEVSVPITLKKGTALSFTQENVEYLYIILSGFVYLYHPPQSADNKDEESFFVGWCGPDQLLGEMEVFTDKSDRWANDPAAEIRSHETCRLIGIPKDTLIRVADGAGVIYRNLCKLLVEKTVQQRKRAEAIQRPKGISQFAQAILNLYEDRGYDQVNSRKRIKGIISHDELAGYLGLSRTSATGNLKTLRKKGAIASQGKGPGNMTTITILSLKKLKECLAQE